MNELRPINELISLKEQSAIVTGAAKGIGQAIAYRLAEAGAKVLIADIDSEVANKVAESLRERGWQAESIFVDVCDEQSVNEMVNSCKTIFSSVDILVNNAGIYPSIPLTQMRLEDFQNVIDVNLKSVFAATKAAVELMKTQRYGKIINITSIDAIHPSMVGLAHYDASKHAVWGFTKNAALELAPLGITVNAVAPGGIYTPGVEEILSRASQGGNQDKVMKRFVSHIPMGRMGYPDEIGKVVLFLASDLASYMTGEQIVVDGGVLLS